MGCVIANACATEKEKQRTLIVEVDPNNIGGDNMANTFIRYVKYRQLVLKTQYIKKEGLNGVICIKYTTYNGTKIIYNGTDLDNSHFAELYQKIVILNDE